MNKGTSAVDVSTRNRDIKSDSFVSYVIDRCQFDNGARAAFKRADNPATEYQSWELLARFNVDLEDQSQRLPFLAVTAAIARANIEKNGATVIGAAIARCYEDGNASDQAKAKLRRLLACDDVSEVCRLLRPLLSFIDSKGNATLNYSQLLDDLLRFRYEESRLRVKARWAQDFYGRPGVKGDDE